MASDLPDSRRKHPHSLSDNESLDHSKRPKHRHHHRSHHRYRSGSKDHDDERRGVFEAMNGGEYVEGVDDADAINRSTQAKADSEMEEGEIVDGDDFSAGCADKVMSGSESGEIRTVGAPSEVLVSITNIKEHEGMFGLTNEQSSVNSIGKSKSPLNTRKKDYIVNGDVGKSSKESEKGDTRLHKRHRSPAKGKSKYKGLSGHEAEEGAWFDRYGVTQSPSEGRCHDEASDRLRSKSPNYRRKSDSETNSIENYSRRGHGHVHSDKDRAKHVLDDERIYDTCRDNRYHVRGSSRDKDREEIHVIDKGRHSDHESWEIESEDKYRDRKTGKERKTRYRDHDEERRHLGSDRIRECGKTREAKKEREHDTKVEKRGRSRGNIHDDEYDEGRFREKDYRHNKERDLEREHRRGSSRSTYKDMDLERERAKSRERYRDRSHEVSDRPRDNGSDRHGDKFKDAGSSRVRRNYGRDAEDRYGNHGASYDSKYRTYGCGEHRGDNKRVGDSENECKENEKNMTRDENAQDDYSENMDLELLEHEEEDINRIKEESRKRREAILKKYRTQESEKKVDPQPDTSEKVFPAVSKETSGKHVPSHVLDGKSDDECDQAFSVGKSPSQNDASMGEKCSGAGALGEGSPKSEKSNDMFQDDIFGDSPAEVRKTGKGDGLLVERSGLDDNWDDPEGYYGYRLGEILDARYEVTAAHGKGVFSIVVRAKDLKAGKGDPEEVAIKIIRNNDTMLKAGMDELVILKKLVGADPDDRRHCVRYISSFKYRNHLCLIFESLHMNLREVLKKFGRNIGLKLTAVRAYSKQLFIALKHLKNCGVLHCDIKPDNMLVNEAKNVLKLCDFGNAMFAGKNEVTPYLVSRFYRAPEIILGLTYDHPLDMWSVGCCLYELYTGKVLFPGATNNDMLRLHMELKGSFPKKMLRKGAFTHQHFDHDLNFLSVEEDLVTKKPIRRLVINIKPKDIGTIIKGSPGEDPKMLANFKDLLDKMFVLDPDKRLTVSQALSHPFITGK